MSPADPRARRQALRDAAKRQRIDATTFLRDIIATARSLENATAFDGSQPLHPNTRIELLGAIASIGGCPNLSDVARRLRVTRQSARAQIVAADRAGIVELFPDSHDRRAIQVALTPRGRAILPEHRELPIDWLFTLLNGLEAPAMRATSRVLWVIRQRLAGYERERKRARDINGQATRW